MSFCAKFSPILISVSSAWQGIYNELAANDHKAFGFVETRKKSRATEEGADQLIKYGKGSVILVNDERSTTPSDKLRAPKKEDAQHLDSV
jgi:hypothetical protein